MHSQVLDNLVLQILLDLIRFQMSPEWVNRVCHHRASLNLLFNHFPATNLM
jgi:hypothetical protein